MTDITTDYDPEVLEACVAGIATMDTWIPAISTEQAQAAARAVLDVAGTFPAARVRKIPDVRLELPTTELRPGGVYAVRAPDYITAAVLPSFRAGIDDLAAKYGCKILVFVPELEIEAGTRAVRVEVSHHRRSLTEDADIPDVGQVWPVLECIDAVNTATSPKAKRAALIAAAAYAVAAVEHIDQTALAGDPQ